MKVDPRILASDDLPLDAELKPSNDARRATPEEIEQQLDYQNWLLKQASQERRRLGQIAIARAPAMHT